MLTKLNQVFALFTPERTEITALEAAELLKRPRSTVYRLLSKIHEAGLLDRDETTGRYRPGIRLATLGELARQSTSLQRIAIPFLKDLSARSGETADLTVLVGSKAVTIEVVESFQPIMLPGLLGGEVPLHATAAGKILLAALSPAEVKRMMSPPLHRYTGATITDFDELVRDLEVSRERGYALVDGEWIDDLVGVGVPVRNYRGGVDAALALGGPRSRMNEAKRAAVVEAAVEAGRRLSTALGFVAPSMDGSDNGKRVR